MANHPLTGAYLPTQAADPPAGGTQISQAVSQLSPYTVPKFTSTAARDSAYASYQAGGGDMNKVGLCIVGDTLYRRSTGGAWLALVVADSDTDWVDMSLASGWSKDVARYRVRNGVYFFTVGGNRSSWSAGQTLFTIGTDAYRPDYAITCTGMFGGSPREVRVQTNGVVVVSASGTGGVNVSGSWPIG